ncbi:hypothetical protein ACSXAE_14970 [Clostridium perfringens]
MSDNNYIDLINEYISLTGKIDFQENKDFYNKLFFTYPSTCLELDCISEIINLIANEFKVPYHDIKIIGSSHLGFSLVKPAESNSIKFFDNTTSDIDIAIINKELFYDIFLMSMKTSKFFKDLTDFKDKSLANYYKKNLLTGFIRPDTIGNKTFRIKWLRFFDDISKEYNMKISAAIYLDEECLHNRLENSFKKYIERMNINGVK